MNAYGKSIGQLISVVFSLIDFYETHIRGNVKCDKYFLSQIDFQLKLVYRLGLVDRGYPIQTLIEFDNQLKNYGIFYHLIDDTFMPAGPIQFKYITYWRKNHSTFFIDLYKSLKKVKSSIKVLFNKK
jgi:DNA-binding MltR family transcriptional regulator